MAYSNYLCSMKPAVGWRAEQPKRQDWNWNVSLQAKENSRVFFIPGIRRQRSEELREDSVNAHNGFSPFTLCLTIDKKCNVMAQIVSLFLKTKATGKWGTKCNADGNCEKAHHQWIWEEAQTLFHACFIVIWALQWSLSYWWSCWKLIQCYTSVWPS